LARLSVRWSETEARKPYARPFMVTFFDDSGGSAGSVAVSGADLLYYRQFQIAVLSLAGELFSSPEVESSDDPQREWLDLLDRLLPDAGDVRVTPNSAFDEHQGRVFQFTAGSAAQRTATVDAASLLEYQEFQAAVAHQTGSLYRSALVESVADPARRHAAWNAALHNIVARPDAAEAMSGSWPWR
jgi:hypothetical protein